MKRVLALLLIIPFFFSCDNGAGETEDGNTIPTPEGWTLVWNDEFDGTSIATNKWTHDVNANGGGNNELQYYTKRDLNSRVENGILILEAHDETFTGPEGTRQYTSAKILSRGKGDWAYGRFDIRAKLPTGQGIWPAIWMMPSHSDYGGWAASGEIDIMEIIGSAPDRLHGTIHFGGSWPRNVSAGAHTDLPTRSLHEDFHVYTIEWKEGEIRWFIDGVQYGRQTEWYTLGHAYPAPFDKPFYLIMNVAVGGNWPGSPDASTAFPQRMEVDYVRVYTPETTE
ncbi:MAG: glycoside hydrolase family 16 protein [Bacteroidota bacterium]|nr:glycoside hydrolase family 16 protein [Bacteroidota bacterium]